MNGGGNNAPPPPPAGNGGEFLLSLLQKPAPTQSQQQQQQSSLFGTAAPISIPLQQPPSFQQHVALDPAVAAVGPSLPFPPPWTSNGRDLPAPWPYALSPPLIPNFLGFPQNPFPSHGNPLTGNQGVLGNDLRSSGSSGIDANFTNYAIQNLILQNRQPQEQKLTFGSFPSEVHVTSLLNEMRSETLQSKILKEREAALGSRNYNSLERNQEIESRGNTRPNSSHREFQNRNSDERRGGGWGRHQHPDGNYRPMTSVETQRPPPGFGSKPRERGNWDFGVRRRNQDQNANRSVLANHKDGQFRGDGEVALNGQLDHPGPPPGSNLHSASASDIEESLLDLQRYEDRDQSLRQDKFTRDDGGGVDDLGEQLDSLLPEDESDEKNGKKQFRKDSRVDNRGQRLLSQRMRNLNWMMECRSDIDRLNASFLEIYESLIPREEEKAKQKQLLALLEKLVCKEWPEARLYLYGSCANSFGVSKSDIDVCLVINDADLNKSEVLLKLADILQSDNLQNVQALTRARVPIVKLKDPATGISCDICINNVLAVVNTKLLRDYAEIDERLRQLAFIVKHWAKSRGVNETYQGTLSSYAYVLMCIHFLQQRRPAILPCLQEMEATYSVTVDDVECAFFDQVEKLRNFGSYNKETIAQLVWAFFSYWAYGHNYASSVISVRTGSIISKHEKDWTRRVGNDRHLICIEDPFETSHDLGRVVDKFSIRVLRGEFERAAEIMQYDPNPCVTLFEPYVPPP
ncbi:hypothetical protein SLA2020_252650 [Shorea laevis]